MSDNRKGILRLGREMLHDYGNEKNKEFMKALFSEFYPIMIVTDYDISWGTDLKYYGYSDNFDVVEEGGIIPEYLVEVEYNMEEWDTVSLRFVKR